MAENPLNLGEFDASLDQVSRIGMAQAVWRNLFDPQDSTTARRAF